MGRGLDLILSGRILDTDEALAMGLLTEVVPPAKHVERSLEMAAGLASFPQKTMLSDRRAALEGFGMPLDDALELEAGSRSSFRGQMIGGR
jgi:enoyl-CoA hydratase